MRSGSISVGDDGREEKRRGSGHAKQKFRCATMQRGPARALVAVPS